MQPLEACIDGLAGQGEAADTHATLSRASKQLFTHLFVEQCVDGRGLAEAQPPKHVCRWREGEGVVWCLSLPYYSLSVSVSWALCHMESGNMQTWIGVQVGC